MVRIIDGNTEVGAQSLVFDLFKAFNQIYTRTTFSELPSNLSALIFLNSFNICLVNFIFSGKMLYTYIKQTYIENMNILDFFLT